MAAKRPTAAEKALLLHRAALDRLQYIRETGREPPTVEQLAMDLGQTAVVLLKLLTRKADPPEFLVAAKHVSSPVALANASDWLASSATLLDFVAARASGKRASSGRPARSDVKKLVADAAIDKQLASGLVARIEALAAKGETPSAIADLLWPTPQEVTRCLLDALRERVELSTAVAPEGLRELLARTGLDARLDPVKLALKSREFLDAVVACVVTTAKEPAYVPGESLERAAAVLVRIGLDRLAASRVTTLFAASAIAGSVVKAKDARTRLDRELERLADQRELPESVGWLREKGKRRFFRRADVEWSNAAMEPMASVPRPVAAESLQTAQADEAQFAQRFDAAFERLDARAGGKNFVKVGELRRELEEYSREVFDAGLRALRVADRYAMESAHGGAVRLSDEELRAGIREGSSLLIYVSRK